MRYTGGNVDYIKVSNLEGQIKDLERELTLASLNERHDDVIGLKAEIRDLEIELEGLYWC